MVSSRLIVFLMMRKGMLYKTIGFSNPKYVGDPLNAVKIFNDLEVDELVIVDASEEGTDIDYELLDEISSVSRMPICYGGKVKNKDQFQKIISMGFEKVLINSQAFIDQSLIESVSQKFGNQSVVVGLDVKLNEVLGQYEVFIHGGLCKIEAPLSEILTTCIAKGAGEILINNISRDGTGMGYDLTLLRKVSAICSVPFTFLGGLSSLQEIKSVSCEFGPLGIAGGSFFTFKGQFRAVLPHYIDPSQKILLLNQLDN